MKGERWVNFVREYAPLLFVIKDYFRGCIPREAVIESATFPLYGKEVEMDKEAQAKIEEILKPTCRLYELYASQVLEAMKKLGYRKPLDRPELREKIADIRRILLVFLLITEGIPRNRSFVVAKQILALIIPKDKPPLLSDKELKKIFDLAYYQNQSYSAGISNIPCEPEDMMRRVAQAQWDIWNKAIYGGE